MTALPLTVSHFSGEPAFSYLSRLAAQNFCTGPELCMDLGLSWPGIANGDQEALHQLAGFGGVSHLDLLAATPRHLNARKSQLDRLILNRASLSTDILRCCLACVKAEVPHIKVEWLHELSFVCVQHATWLQPLTSLPDHPYPLDVVSRLAEFDPVADLAQDVIPQPFDTWMASRLRGQQGDHWLDGFEFQAALDVCDLLGRSLVKDEFPQLQDMTRQDRHKAISAAFDFLTLGAAGFNQALNVMDLRFNAPNGGLAARYGVLYKNLDRYLSAAAYDPFKDLLRGHIFATWPIATGQPVLGKALEQRQLHSIVTAAKEIRCQVPRLRAILTAYGYVPAGDNQSLPGQELFDASQVQEFLSLVARGVTLNEILNLLNMSRSQIETLRAAGFLEPEIQGEGFAPLWDPVAASQFLGELRRDARHVAADDPEFLSIGAAGLKLRIPPGDIIKLRLDDRLPPFGCLAGVEGYQGLVIRTKDLAAVRELKAENLNIEDFAKVVGLRWHAARRLVMNGLTPSTIMRNPASGALQNYLTPADVDAFHARYATLMTLSQEQGRSWQAISKCLREKAVPKFMFDKEDFGQIWERKLLGS